MIAREENATMNAHAANGETPVAFAGWMKWTAAAALLGALMLSACAMPSGTDTSSGLRDPSSGNAESVPSDAWFKDRPQ